MKRVIFTSLLSIIVFTGTTTVHAEDSWKNVTGSEDGKGAASHAHMHLVPSDDTDNPTEPLDPSQPGGETGNKGPLTIDNVTPLEFGEHKLVGGESVFSTTSIKPNVQVTDNRGEGQGWTLQVTSSEFVDVADTKKILKGAVLKIPAGELKTTAGNVSEKPEIKEIQLGTDQSSTDTIMSAQSRSGMGTWVDLFDASQLTVTVPAGNFAGDYVSTLTWTLLDTPTA